MKKINMKYRIAIIAICMLLCAPNIYAQNATTQAQVNFTAGEGPTSPVDPEDPGTDIDTEPPVTGSLAIVSVSNFNFGNIPVTTRAGLYDIVTEKPNIQVVDLRGTNTGWAVTASVSKFTSEGEDSLQGASILITNGRANSLSTPPGPVQITDLSLPADGTPKKAITAPNGTTSGLWVMRWYPGTEETDAYIQLSVPAGRATKGTHTATINWTLADTP